MIRLTSDTEKLKISITWEIPIGDIIHFIKVIKELLAGDTTTTTPTTEEKFIQFGPDKTLIIPEDLNGANTVVLTEGLWPQLALVGLEGVEVIGQGRKTQIGNNDPSNRYALALHKGNNVSLSHMFVYGHNGLKCEGGQRSVKLRYIDIESDLSNFFGFASKTDGVSDLEPYDIDLAFIRVKRPAGEPFYIGQTVGSDFHNLRNVRLENIKTYQAGRENFQGSHTQNLYINKFNGVGGGQTDENGQNRAIQIQDTNGLIENSFFITTGLSDIATIRSGGLTIRNTFLEGRNNIYLTNLLNQTWWPTHSIDMSLAQLWEKCIFHALDPVEDFLFQKYSDHELVVKDSIISDNLKKLFDKDRKTCIDGGGNVFLPASDTIFHPQFDEDQNCISEVHIDRGMGADSW